MSLQNLVFAPVVVPFSTGSTLNVQPGTGARFDGAQFPERAVLWQTTDYTDAAEAFQSPLGVEAEIVELTSIVGDALTVVRAQEGTSAIVSIVGKTYRLSVAATQGALKGTLIPKAAVIVDEKTSATPGGGAVIGSFLTRDLNTIVSDPDSLVTVVANQVTLVAGTYHVWASAPAQQVDGHQIRLHNVTDDAQLLLGTTEKSAAADTSMTRSFIHGDILVWPDPAKLIELQHQVETAQAVDGWGSGTSFASPERYATLTFVRISD